VAAERSLLDPFGVIAEFAAQIEKAGNRAGNEHMRSAEFSAALNRALAVSVGAKKLSGDALRRMQLLFNVASHDDIVAVTEKLQAIDEKLLAIAQVLERLDPQAPPPERARPRTRKPPPQPAPAAPAPVVAEEPAPVRARRRPSRRKQA
jgi:hypothetical protein